VGAVWCFAVWRVGKFRVWTVWRFCFAVRFRNSLCRLAMASRVVGFFRVAVRCGGARSRSVGFGISIWRNGLRGSSVLLLR
jgi:hypothetical protein